MKSSRALGPGGRDWEPLDDVTGLRAVISVERRDGWIIWRIKNGKGGWWLNRRDGNIKGNEEDWVRGWLELLKGMRKKGIGQWGGEVGVETTQKWRRAYELEKGLGGSRNKWVGDSREKMKSGFNIFLRCDELPDEHNVKIILKRKSLHNAPKAGNMQTCISFTFIISYTYECSSQSMVCPYSHRRGHILSTHEQEKGPLHYCLCSWFTLHVWSYWLSLIFICISVDVSLRTPEWPLCGS